MNILLRIVKKLILIQNDSLVRMTTEVAESGVKLLMDEPLASPHPDPAFNHTWYDCINDPCPICASQMSNAQLLAAIKNLQETVHKEAS